MADRRGSVVVDTSDVKVTSVIANVVVDEGATLDEKALGALGYRQEFKRYGHLLRCHELVAVVGSTLTR